MTFVEPRKIDHRKEKTAVKVTTYDVWILDSVGRPNSCGGMFIAEKGNPPVVLDSRVAVEEGYGDDIDFWLKHTKVEELEESLVSY